MKDTESRSREPGDGIPDWMAREVAEYDLDLNPPPATILDIGANIGAFSLHYHRKWPIARIWAYEPVRETFHQLVGNVAHIRHRVFPFRCAVRSFNGDGKIFLGDMPATSGFHQRGRQTQQTERVECVAAKKLIPAELVKIDTEGCEVEILKDLDLSAARAVVVEYHSLADCNQIMTFLLDAGFEALAAKAGSPEHGVIKFARPNAGVSLPPLPPVKKPIKVYLAVASHYASNDLMFVQSLLAVVIRTTVPLAVGFSADPSVERARNILTANFLASDCTHILFVDSDIGFNAEDVARICSHEQWVVGGMYPLKSMTPTVTWCGNAAEEAVGGRQKPEAREDGLVRVKYIGTGFLCIARAAFEQILLGDAAAIEYRQDFPPHRIEHAFWRQGVAAGRFLTEDWMFCQRWNELGGQIWADTRVVLKHAGRAEWPLALQAGNPFAAVAPPVKKEGALKD